jgi:hypothetical protein
VQVPESYTGTFLASHLGRRGQAREQKKSA